MSGYGLTSAGAYATTAVRPKVMAVNRPRRKKTEMKLTWKQRFRNWLHNDSDQPDEVISDVEPANLQSEGMRFQLYKATGGYVIETTQYDYAKDRRLNKMYVIGNDADLGAELGKIVTMEALRA